MCRSRHHWLALIVISFIFIGSAQAILPALLALSRVAAPELNRMAVSLVSLIASKVPQSLQSATTAAAYSASAKIATQSNISSNILTWTGFFGSAGLAAYWGNETLIANGLSLKYNSDGTVNLSGSASGQKLSSSYSTSNDWQNGEHYIRNATTGVYIKRIGQEWVCPTGWCAYANPNEPQPLCSTSLTKGCYNRLANEIIPSSPRAWKPLFTYVPKDNEIITPPDLSIPRNANEAVAAIPSTAYDLQLTDKALADMANQVWKQVDSTTGAEVWSATNPITASDVQAWRVANTASFPTVRDFARIATDAQSNSIANPATAGTGTGTGTGTVTGTGTGTGTSVTTTNISVDFGTAPKIEAPTLQPKTAKDVISPLNNFLPDFKKFQMPQYSSTCPTITLNFFDRNYNIDQHCNLLEQNRSFFQAISMLLWILICINIILKA